MSRRFAKLGFAVALAMGGLATFRTCLSAPLPEGHYEGPGPTATPPEDLRLFAIPTGHVRRQASSAYRGGSFFEERNSAVAAALVRHPKGDLLIDTGFGRTIDEQIKLLPYAFRAITTYVVSRPAADQLKGIETKNLRILLTHAHWDHTSGLADFPGTPVMLTREERRFIDEGGARTVIARTTPNTHYEEYGFENIPYLGYPRSHDVFGDGSVVIVPSPGHTPGSVIIFVSLPTKRYAFIGDLAWQREGVSQREERPWFWREAVDSDEAAVRAELVHFSSIATRFPDLVVVPAHDLRAFDAIPVFAPPPDTYRP